MKPGSLGAAAAWLPALSWVSLALADKQLQLQPLAARLEPLRLAEVALVDGQVVMTSDWTPYGGVANHCSATICWDAFEQDGTGFPTGPNLGCSSTCRWYFGTAHCQGGNINDMNDIACPGTRAEELEFAWYWSVADQGSGGTSESCIIVVFTAEDDWGAGEPDDAECLAGLSSVFPGIAYDFGSVASGGYYYSYISLCGTRRGHQLPTDGAGTVVVLYRTGDVNTVATCAQSMLWGTDEDEPFPWGEARVGTQQRLQYDDDGPMDGTFSMAGECYDYLYGLYPDPLCAMNMFYGEDEAGCDPCDTNCDGSVNGFDIQAFIEVLAGEASGCSHCSADITLDGSVNGFDIQGFVDCLGG